jgi:hypothetical protein
MMLSMKKVIGWIALICVLILPFDASAHHSRNGKFDNTVMIELEGEITRLIWKNPHVRFTIRVRSNDGEEELWEIETTSISHLRNQNITKALLAVGDKVKVAGNPSVRGVSAMWVTNVLLTNQQELVIDPKDKPRWTDQILGRSGARFVEEGDASAPELGIYRVWTHTAVVPMLFPSTRDPDFDLSSYPLTDVARLTLAAYDPINDNPTANCRPKGMPIIMEQPYPLEFVAQDPDIVLRLEEYDTTRVIHMTTDATPQGKTPHRLGYSIGRWEDQTLVVTTVGINYGHFNQMGIPLSDDVEIEERFTPSDDGSRMDYKMRITDPATFAEPIELQKYWLYVPGVTVESYGCVSN